MTGAGALKIIRRSSQPEVALTPVPWCGGFSIIKIPKGGIDGRFVEKGEKAARSRILEGEWASVNPSTQGSTIYFLNDERRKIDYRTGTQVSLLLWRPRASRTVTPVDRKRAARKRAPWLTKMTATSPCHPEKLPKNGNRGRKELLVRASTCDPKLLIPDQSQL